MNKKDISDDSTVIRWLLEDNNAAVKYRTQTEILDILKDSEEVKTTRSVLLESDLIKSAMDWFNIGKSHADRHGLTALVEYGLTRNDVNIDSYVDKLIENHDFCDECGNVFLLRNLVALGFAEHPTVKKELVRLFDKQQSDGGYTCVDSSTWNPKDPNKSCYRKTTMYLLLISEMYKKGIDCPSKEGIINYYLSRDVLYRHDDPDHIIINIGTFHPPFYTRIGWHMILCALAILGKGNDPGCTRLWEILDSKCNGDGKYILDGSLTKPYIKKETKGKPSKWVTFYVLLAEKYRRL